MTRVLIVSPIPSHPQDQGNSARIFALGRLLQSAGALVDFLYHPLEGLSAAQAAAMRAAWDGFHVVPVERMNLAPRAEGYHRLDDWYEPKAGAAAAALHARHRYAAVIANYVWFSGVLEAFDDGTLRVLDTHDVFGGRDHVFRAAGLAPEWFWTTPAEEARGLARADLVLAIQDEEAAVFRALGHGSVLVLGHLPAWRRRAAAGGTVRFGYFASSNPINLDSFTQLRAALPAAGVAGARLIVAGALCDRLGDAAPFEMLGRLPRAEDFYDAVDVVLNPMSFGTGLKIKSVEALFQDLPLVATRAGMSGLPARHALHRLDGPEAVAAALPELARDAAARAALGRAGAVCAARYARATRDAAAALWRRIEQAERAGAARAGGVGVDAGGRLAASP